MEMRGEGGNKKKGKRSIRRKEKGKQEGRE